MLVLSRKDREVILIGDNIRIVVLSTSAGRTRLGIEAPRDVLVIRGELGPLTDMETADVQ